MAFPIPSHLPRKSTRKDVATEILTKIDEASVSSLTSTLASSWVSELDAAIKTTQERIHERIQNDRETVDRQLASSKSIQTRLQSLETNVLDLRIAVTDSQTGIVPTLLKTLTAHSELAKEAAHASTTFAALSHLVQLKQYSEKLGGLVESGELCDAVSAFEAVDELFEQSPPALQRSTVFRLLKNNVRVVKDKAREQLGEAYSRSIMVGPSEMLIYPSVQVRQSTSVLQLPSILSSLDTTSLSTFLDTLRRDVTNHFIHVVMNQPTSCSPSSTTDISGNSNYKLTLFHSPPNESTLTQRLDTLSTILDFLSSYLFPVLPNASRDNLMKALSKIVTNSILNDLLIPNIPTAFSLLPPYLELVQHSLDFEDEYVAGLLEPGIIERPVQTWARGLRGHYERQRRSLILDASRKMIVVAEDSNDTFTVEIDVPVSSALGVVAVQEIASPSPSPIPDLTRPTPEPEPVPSVDNEADNAWGLEEDEGETPSADSIDDNGWGFDDEVADADTEVGTEDPPTAADVSPSISSDYSLPNQTNSDGEPVKVSDNESDPADAWGWNDGEDEDSPPTDESAWDDPWDDEASSKPAVPSPPCISVPNNTPAISSSSSPKVATRLEKFSKLKNAHRLSSPAVSSPLASPLGILSPPSPTQTTPTIIVPETALPRTAVPNKIEPVKRPPNLFVRPKETYTVSSRVKRILTYVQDTLREGSDFSASSSKIPLLSSASSTSNILLQSAPEILDLYRALYPITFQSPLQDDAKRTMQFSNDCLYLSDELAKLGNERDEVKDRLAECQRHFNVLSESWYQDCIEKHRVAVDDILVTGADGFTQSTDQERYDEYEQSLTEVLSLIRKVSQKWKGTLSKSKYYTAIGQVTDAALSRVLQDILALSDITEVESHRLSELCRILNALEALFIEDDGDHPFTAAYVPSWLKFSYLSELLEASMADITYLFEEGALVDFAIEELVRLVQALFADTPLRSSTITKLQAGHPATST